MKRYGDYISNNKTVFVVVMHHKEQCFSAEFGILNSTVLI